MVDLKNKREKLNKKRYCAERRGERVRKTDKGNDRNGQKQSEREGERKKRKGTETRCSLWVAWSRSCPINTGEQLDRPGPPG